MIFEDYFSASGWKVKSVQTFNAERSCTEEKQKAQREHSLCCELQVAYSVSRVLMG